MTDIKTFTASLPLAVSGKTEERFLNLPGDSVFYIPLTRPTLAACLRSLEYDFKTPALGSGSSAQVIQVCTRTTPGRTGNCNFVAKVSKLVFYLAENKSDKVSVFNYELLYEFFRERYAYETLSKKHVGLIPYYYGSWICGKHAFTILEKMGTNLYNMFTEIDIVTKLKHTRLPDNIYRNCLELIKRINGHGILHADVHLQNILVTPNQNDMVLSDFGRCGDFRYVMPNLVLWEDSYLQKLDKSIVNFLMQSYDYIFFYWYISTVNDNVKAGRAMSIVRYGSQIEPFPYGDLLIFGRVNMITLQDFSTLVRPKYKKSFRIFLERLEADAQLRFPAYVAK